MESRFAYISKMTFRFMCLFVAITLLKQIRHLNRKSWNFKTIKFYSNKHILLWTDQFHAPFSNMGKGRNGFIARKCAYTNCVVTADRNFFRDIGKFDVIAFHAPDVSQLNGDLPERRLPHQKYVFASKESSDNYPICSKSFDGYFNWTWTYKLDSEVRWGYIVIRDSKGVVVGPNIGMKWLDWAKMNDVNNEMKERLKSKTKAVAWIVSNCKTKSRRELFFSALLKQLLEYELSIDVYGMCGRPECPVDDNEDCFRMIENEYYFYLAFENALSEDYVTENVLIPLQYNAIPIVYGGANYTRFLPPASYLDARQLGSYKLAEKIYMLIQDPDMYASYFKWKNHYSYHKTSDSPETDEYCQMCALLNNEKKMKQTSVYEKFQAWWNSPKPSCL